MFGLGDDLHYKIEEMKRTGNEMRHLLLEVKNNYLHCTNSCNSIDEVIEDWDKAIKINPFDLEE